MLLSPTALPLIPGAVDSTRQSSGSIFTSFLTAPLQAFLLLVGFSGSDIDMVNRSQIAPCTSLFSCFSYFHKLKLGKCVQDLFNKAENLVTSSLNHWGSILITSDGTDPVWTQVLTDPLLRRLLLRYLSTSIFFAVTRL